MTTTTDDTNTTMCVCVHALPCRWSLSTLVPFHATVFQPKFVPLSVDLSRSSSFPSDTQAPTCHAPSTHNRTRNKNSRTKYKRDNLRVQRQTHQPQILNARPP